MTFQSFILKIKLFINENYFWKNHRAVHTALTYNHYLILFGFFTLSTISLTVIKKSELVIICFAFLLLIEQVLFRPYSEISEKIRAIYFFFLYILITIIRYINNYVINGQYNAMLAGLVLILLATALVWAYAKIISHFIGLFAQRMATENIVVDKIFNNDVTDSLDREAVAE